MPKDIHPITVDLSVETWEALSKAAAKDKRKVAWLAKQIIMVWLINYNEKEGIENGK
jgi:hypothetical protein